ncbi:class I SAM-dependent methyltransferase [Deinococcus sp. JMULE3]|uniref:class I SAM-dependent methyltransferase n=1 Tax=Deinococcus sp. JMULE3 TaxID=2518341 RepID=UPI00157609F8|nr:class I SAM-dependent methyltransferase [Deinococcus sp. JMULE3]NTY02426.1 class I SAM-dependent methyltransferase [Deinococcus sp. JMULE3]
MTTLSTTIELADEVLALFESQRDWEAAQRLWPALRTWRLADPLGWPDRIAELRGHPVFAHLHTCPFTHRAFHKPRGYAGDAVMLDHMYGLTLTFPHPASPGGRLYAYTTNSPAAHAVRERRARLADLIDRAAARRPDARIVALAAGHGRELGQSGAVRRGTPITFVAVDQDRESLNELRRSYPDVQTEVVTGNIRDVITGDLTFDADVVYAAGLFDYLPDSAARRLTSRMARMLRPGGEMLIANFVPDCPDIGFMEACMDWHLITRTQEQVHDLFADVPYPEQVVTALDDYGTIAYGLWSRPV